MPLKRVLEPEVMDTEAEAIDYDSMDHCAVNQQFVLEVLAFAKAQGCSVTNVLDMGTGTAQIPIELCRQHDSATVLAIDLAQHMLDVGNTNVIAAGFSNRITLEKVDAKKLPYADGRFPAVISNSIIHHIPEPKSCIAEMARVADRGAVIFVRDLMRPNSDAEVQHIVDTYAGNENDHSRQMFDDSLRAALSLTEMQDLVGEFGFDAAQVTATSDRHWTWSAIK